MKNPKEVKEIRETILKGDCKITVKGINTYQKIDNDNYGYALQNFKVSKDSGFIEECDTIGFGGMMNIKKITKNCIYLYTYSIMHNRIDKRINFNDITIVK